MTAAKRTTVTVDATLSVRLPAGTSLAEAEQQLILMTLRALRAVGGNRSHAAQILGLNRTTVVLKLKQYGVPSRPAGRPREKAK